MPTFVERTWVPRPDAYGPRSARAPFVYRAFVPDRVAAVRPSLTAGVVGDLEAAAVEVQGLQVQHVFTGLEAASRQLLRAEALASSRIEGLEVGHRRIATAIADGNAPDDTVKSVIANIAAMERAIRLATETRTLIVDDLLAIHDSLLVLPRERTYAGRIRDEQNWIGTSSISPRDAEFIPPPETLVRDLLGDLMAFAERDDLSPIVQAAIVHAQFETIHPFVDGNGRVGRAFLHVILRRGNVAPRIVPPISVLLATNQRRYIEGLTAYRTGDLDGWTGFFARALRDSATAARHLGEQIAALETTWRDAVKPRAGSASAALIDRLAGNPVVSVRVVESLLGVSYPAANAAIERLESAGVLVPVRASWRRNRLWESQDLLALLDAFDAAQTTPTRHEEPRRPAPRRRR